MVDAVYTHVEIYGSRVSSGQRLRPVCQIQPGESTFYFRFPPLAFSSCVSHHDRRTWATIGVL
jgi:hypothetical protein